MTDLADLERAVVSLPGDDTLRLAVADWLDDHGAGRRDHYRAKFIRLQIQSYPKALAHRCVFCRGGSSASLIRPRQYVCRCEGWWQEYESRERYTLAEWMADEDGPLADWQAHLWPDHPWPAYDLDFGARVSPEGGGRLPAMPGWGFDTGLAARNPPEAVWLTRGFPRALRCSLADFERAAPWLRRSFPLEVVDLNDRQPQRVGRTPGAGAEPWWYVWHKTDAGRGVTWFVTRPIFDRLDGFVPGVTPFYSDRPDTPENPHPRAYPTRGAAAGALAAAAVAWLRDPAGVTTCVS